MFLLWTSKLECVCDAVSKCDKQCPGIHVLNDVPKSISKYHGNLKLLIVASTRVDLG